MTGTAGRDDRTVCVCGGGGHHISSVKTFNWLQAGRRRRRGGGGGGGPALAEGST